MGECFGRIKIEIIYETQLHATFAEELTVSAYCYTKYLIRKFISVELHPSLGDKIYFKTKCIKSCASYIACHHV